MSTAYTPDMPVVVLDNGAHLFNSDERLTVTVNDEKLEYLTQASRRVYVSRDMGIVVKVSTRTFDMGQCWDEFAIYHTLDEDAKAIVPEVFAFGADEVGGSLCAWDVQEFVPDFVQGYDSSVEGVPYAAERWQVHVGRILSNKYDLSDLHGGNLGYRKSTMLPCLVDLGISNKATTRHTSPTCSAVVRQAAERLSPQVQAALDLVLA